MENFEDPRAEEKLSRIEGEAELDRMVAMAIFRLASIFAIAIMAVLTFY